jgi:hypothetical protein
MAEDVSSTDTATVTTVTPVGGAVSPIAAEARGYAREEHWQLGRLWSE